MKTPKQNLPWSKQVWHEKLSSYPLLASQQSSSWDKFNRQHVDATANLNETQLERFKCAITLSDFILSSAMQAPALVIALFQEDSFLLPALPDYESLLKAKLQDCESEAQLHQKLRQFRLQQMVYIAVADLLDNMSLDASLHRLSSLADELILASLNWLTLFCEKQWGTPTDASGNKVPLLVYGMGKLGGKELNFSSDIDLIFTYPQRGETVGHRRSLDNQQFFTRLGQKLITSLNQQTVDGFVYRVDMRLRPFGESGPLVLAFDAMEDYYQEQGRDWERYAMLKARLLGNSEYHIQLENMLRPFIYRRYIDFSVIDSLRRMKSMISQEVRRKQLVNNIKLGAGGIREVEFIVQVFQLIRGGRIKSLQQKSLLTVLPKLVVEGEISDKTKILLENTYRFLRRLENIIQALADKQTQTLPDNELDQQRILSVLNIPSWSALLSDLEMHMQGVHKEFELLIGFDSPNQQAEEQHWVTLWLSRWGREESIAWIESKDEEGCTPWNSEEVWRSLSDFREGISKKSLGNRGRQVLDKLIPLLLGHLHETCQKAYVLQRVLVIFNKIVTRTAYLELLFENEGALKQLIHLCQASPWVADYIAKYPILLDELIDPELQHRPVKLTEYALELRESMLRIPEEDLEAQMDSLRL
ncbi:MAG: bifunctional [glutamate--ammonia ligase]-adenylyl-L-tyrosine phosphorylase/[glutamate--ammonia-ligase] adenylyltransferase, partial [Colwellia sp.]